MTHGCNIENTLYFAALGAGIDPDKITSEVRTMIEDGLKSLPIGSLKVMDIMGGAIKAGFDALHQRGLDGVEEYTANVQGAALIGLRLGQNMEYLKAAAMVYIDGIGLDKNRLLLYKEVMGLFYDVQLDSRKVPIYGSKLEQLYSIEGSSEQQLLQ